MKKVTRPDYREHERAAVDFLKNFTTSDGHKKYFTYLEEYAQNKRIEIPIDIDDVEHYQTNNTTPQFPRDFASHIIQNTVRYVKIFMEAAGHKDFPERDTKTGEISDAILESRKAVAEQDEREDGEEVDPANRIPKMLKRKYEIVFRAPKYQGARPIRQVKSQNIGSLLTIRGIVTRITEVRPFVQVATYTCSQCGCEIFQQVTERSYKPLMTCTTPTCKEQKNLTPLHEMTRGFKFTKFQECKVQELPEEVPQGNVPRSITVYIFGENTRKCQCGDKVTVTGIWLPLRASGWRAMKQGLRGQTYLHAQQISREKKGYSVRHHSDEIMAQVKEASEDPDIYNKLARSLAPEFYGLEDVKKALLLLLVAGVTKKMKDGMKIRGDINILLMGDPGVAKSQLLRAVCRIAPRAVYTTGQGSSGVGLTAAVLRDKVTKDMVLEAGALVLADMGICCIDEFDKMEETDRTAIHEVMEQQTVSIAKAGVTTTLNARTAVLAAANPAFGRFNKRKSVEQNINLPAALLSRFDLLWVIVDRPDHDRDLNLARHIAYVHQHDTYPELDFKAFSPDFLRAYIAKAREFEPTIPKDLSEFIVMSYVNVRQSALGEDNRYDSRKIIGTPRALLSILRLSQALARLRFSETVTRADVEEAMRLITESKKSTLQEEEEFGRREDEMTRIYQNMKEWLDLQPSKTGKMDALVNVLTARGFTHDKISETLEEYSDLDVIFINASRITVKLL
jgi:DNA replication licensing factor MCM7